MNPILSLLIRIACGDRYEVSTRKDLVGSIALLATLPVPVGASFVVAANAANWSTPVIWLAAIGVVAMQIVMWAIAVRVPSLRWLTVLLVCTWSIGGLAFWRFISS